LIEGADDETGTSRFRVRIPRSRCDRGMFCHAVSRETGLLFIAGRLSDFRLMTAMKARDLGS
jgi:hypothetical protein